MNKISKTLVTLLTVGILSATLTGCEDANGRDIFLKSPEQGHTAEAKVNLEDKTRESLEKAIQNSSPIIVGAAVIPGVDDKKPIGVNIQVNVDTLTTNDTRPILAAIADNLPANVSQVNLTFYSANTTNTIDITQTMESLGLAGDKITENGTVSEMNKEFLSKFASIPSK